MIYSKFEMATGERVWLLENFFDRELASEITCFFLGWDQEPQAWLEQDNFAHYRGRRVYQGQADTVDSINHYCQQPGVQSVIQQLAGKSLEFAGTSLWLDQAGYAIAPHLDVMTDNFEFYGVQIYMAAETVPTIGTMFYNNQHEPLFNLVYKNNAGYFMDRSDRILHGLNPVPSGIDRYSVHIRYRVV